MANWTKVYIVIHQIPAKSYTGLRISLQPIIKEDTDISIDVFDVTGARAYPFIHKEAGPGIVLIEVEEMETVLGRVVGCGLVPILKWLL